MTILTKIDSQFTTFCLIRNKEIYRKRWEIFKSDMKQRSFGIWIKATLLKFSTRSTKYSLHEDATNNLDFNYGIFSL